MMLYQKQIITKTSGFAHKHKKVKKNAEVPNRTYLSEYVQIMLFNIDFNNLNKLQIKCSYTIVGCELLTHFTIDVNRFMDLTKITVSF